MRAQYAIRLGTTRGKGLYVVSGGWVSVHQKRAARYPRSTAKLVAAWLGKHYRLVRLLAPRGKAQP